MGSNGGYEVVVGNAVGAGVFLVPNLRAGSIVFTFHDAENIKVIDDGHYDNIPGSRLV